LRAKGLRWSGHWLARGGCAILACLVIASGAQAQEVVEYYGTDALGSVRVVFDASGAIVARADYLPYGEEVTAAGPMPAEHFTGQARDAEAGMDYFHARQYQPRTGRFNAVDPVFAGLLDPQYWNRYSYVGNNPLSWADPTGRNKEGPAMGSRFCGAENDFRKCGGEDGFWDTGGGGGIGFGNEYAEAISNGYVPGMSADMWAGLDRFNRDLETTIQEHQRAQQSPSGATVATRVVGIALLDGPEIGPMDLFALAILAAEILDHLAEPDLARPYPGNDPSRSPGEGWEWKGSGQPGSGRGNWHNPGTGESLHPDVAHPWPVGPHWDWRAPDGKWYRIHPDGTTRPR
jgi:RHS repeat-associated protein